MGKILSVIGQLQVMPGRCPNWLQYALAEELLQKYKGEAWPTPEIAFETLQASCHDVLGWGADGKPGLAAYKGCADAKAVWSKVCKRCADPVCTVRRPNHG